MIKIKIASKTDIVKNVVTFVVAGGVSKIVNGIATNNTEPETTYQHVEIKSASLVLGAAVALRCQEYTDKCIDDIAAAFSKKSNEPILKIVTD